MTDIRTTVPPEVAVGDTVEWKISDGDYPASTYTLSYALRNASGKIDITATASGEDHLVSEDTSTTGAWTAGTYDYQAYMTSATERFLYDTGQIIVLPDFSSNDTYDNRSHVKKVLDALEAVILSKASKDQLSYSIEGRSIARLSPTEIMEWRSVYRAMYKQELRAAGKLRKAQVKVTF